MDTLSYYLNSNYSLFQNFEFILRVIVAGVCGGFIGLERSRRFKEAGLRTHIIVCIGAALAMILSKYGFADMVKDGIDLYGARGADSSRIASQVVSGISFLGAGVIFRHGRSLHGLTTAAGIWTSAIIGMTIGAGLYSIGVITTVFIMILQFFMHRHATGADNYSIYKLKLSVRETSSFLTELSSQLAKWDVSIVSTKIKKAEEGITKYDLTLRVYKNVTIEKLHDYIINIENVVDLDGISVE